MQCATSSKSARGYRYFYAVFCAIFCQRYGVLMASLLLLVFSFLFSILLFAFHFLTLPFSAYSHFPLFISAYRLLKDRDTHIFSCNVRVGMSRYQKADIVSLFFSFYFLSLRFRLISFSTLQSSLPVAVTHHGRPFALRIHGRASATRTSSHRLERKFMAGS